KTIFKDGTERPARSTPKKLAAQQGQTTILPLFFWEAGFLLSERWSFKWNLSPILWIPMQLNAV
ncbi:MAG: hypothetical protein IJM98_09155, partial [Oscillospiraceae bacterium]|nr:hypothetical protein [Oscillospiraceae bacterium]